MEDLSSPQLAEFSVVDQSLEQLGLADLGAVAFGQVKVQIMNMALQESPDETNKRSFEVVAQANQPRCSGIRTSKGSNNDHGFTREPR